jgi:hypothetical protein
MLKGRARLFVLLALVLGAGYLIGTWKAGPSVHTGRADSMADGGGTILTADWDYGFARDVEWVGADGTWHDSGPPDCLPPMSSVEGLRFAATEVTVDGVTWRPVVWIDCRSVPAPN